MYTTFSHTFTSPTHGEKKFYLTNIKGAADTTFEGKINDDNTVAKFKLKKDESGQWKILDQEKQLPDWVHALESDFHTQIEAVAAK